MRTFSFDRMRFLVAGLAAASLALSTVVGLPAATPAAAQTASALGNDFDYYAELDGTQYFKSTADVLPGSNATIEVWIKPNSYVAGTPTLKTIAAQAVSGTTIAADSFYLGLVWSSNRYAIRLNAGTGGTSERTLVPGDGVPVDAWSHVAVVFGNTTSEVYFNGQLLLSSGPRADLGAGFTVGATGGDTPSNFFDGGIDQVKIWNTNFGADSAARSANLQQSMHAWGAGPITSATSTLLAHYDFNDKSAPESKVFDRISPADSTNHLDISGAPEFVDVKEVRELLAQQIFTFKRSYLTATGGWRTPAGATSASTLLVGGGGAGGSAVAWNSGGGGGGEVAVNPTRAITSSSVLAVTVGQGGVSIINSSSGGQKTLLGAVAALGGGFGSYQPNVAGGGSPDFFTGGGGSSQVNPIAPGVGTARNGGQAVASDTESLQAGGGGGGAGGNGLNATSSKGGNGGPGVTPTLSPFAGATYGGGGGGGKRRTGAGGEGGSGGGGAGGLDAGGTSATANTGGGGGGAGDDSVTFAGGNGGSGLVVVAVNFVAKCAFGTNGFTTTQTPKLLTFPLGGLTNPRSTIITDTTTQAAWYGKPAIIDGKFYTVDRGRAQMKRVNLDGTNVEYLGSLTNTVGLGVATDGRYVYGWGATGIARYDTQTDEYIQTLIARGVMNPRTGEMQFYRHTDGVGYLFITNGADGVAGLSNRGQLFAVPVSGTTIPSSVTADHLFSESQLDGEASPQDLNSGAVTVTGGKVYWAPLSTSSTTPAFIYEKAITTANLSTRTPLADKVIADALWIRTLSSDSGKVFWNLQVGTIRSYNLATSAVVTESSTGLVNVTSAGLLVAADCALPPSDVNAALDSDGKINVGWSSIYPTGQTGGATYRVEYRVNGGEWISAAATNTSTTLSVTLPPSTSGLVETRVATNAFGQISQFVNSPVIKIENVVTPLCTDPMRLVYEVPANTEVALTLGQNGGPRAVTIDWGDGNRSPTSSWSVGQVTFRNTYAAAGSYQVDVCGPFNSIYNLPTPQLHLTAVKSWGESGGTVAAGQTRPTGGTLTSLGYAFFNAAKLVEVPPVLPASVTNISYAFRGATAFNDPNVRTWNTTNVIAFNGAFHTARAFNQDISTRVVGSERYWDTSNARSIQEMFQNASSFNQDISNWNTSQVTQMVSMFSGARVFNQPLNTTPNGTVDGLMGGPSWDVSKVTSLGSMFAGATSFNQPLDDWDTSKVAFAVNTFFSATFFNQDISTWDTRSLISTQNMFYRATAFNNAGQPLLTSDTNKWNTSNVTNMSAMFYQATAFNQDISNWNTSKVTNMSYMFFDAGAFNQNIGSWNTSMVTNMDFMFRNAKNFNQPLNFQINALTTARNMLDFSGMSDQNYSTTVENLKVRYDALAAGAKRNNISFGATDKTAFCNAPNAAVNFLVTTAGWTIADKTNRTANFCTTTVTITAKNEGHVYGDPVPSIGYTMTSSAALPTSDWLSEIECKAVAVSGGAAVVSTSNSAAVSTKDGNGTVSGTYKTVCTGPSGTGLGIAVTYKDGTYEVKKRPISVRAQDKSAFQGQTSPSLGFGSTTITSSNPTTADLILTAGSIAAGDTLTFTTASTGSSLATAGTSPITITADSAAPTSNYTVTAVPGTLTVSSLTYIIAAKSQSKAYGDTKAFTDADWTCTVKVGSVAEACGAGVVATASLSSAGASASSNVGTYSIAVSSVSITAGGTAIAANQIETVGSDIVVTKRKLTVTPRALTVPFGGSAPTYEFDLGGFATGQSAADLPADYEPTCTSGYVAPGTNTLGSPRGSEFVITCTGGSANNYEFEFADGVKLTVPLQSEVSDQVPQTVMLEPEEFETQVAFNFVLTPVNQICFATLLLVDEYGNAIELDATGEPLRQQIEPGTAVNFEVPLIIGNYDYELKVDGNCDIATTQGSFGIQEFVAASGGGGGYFGPIISGASTRNIDTCKPTLVTLAGQRLDAVMAASVQGRLVRIADKRADVMVIEVPAGLTPATGVDLVLESSFGRLTVQSVFNIVGPATGFTCAEVGEAAQFWTKRISPTQVKFYAKWPVGAGKIQFMVDGREIGWVRATSDSDRKLIVAQGRNYFVRTVTLKPGKNRFEIRVDGERVRRATYTGR